MGWRPSRDACFVGPCCGLDGVCAVLRANRWGARPRRQQPWLVHLRFQGVQTKRSPPDNRLVWHPLCLCSFLFKVHDDMLWTTTKRKVTEPIPQQFAFVRGCKSMEVTELLRMVLQKGHEWTRPAYIACVVAEKAFDDLEASSGKRPMLARHAPEWALAAVFQELVGQRAWAKVVGVACKEPITIGRHREPRQCGRIC